MLKLTSRDLDIFFDLYTHQLLNSDHLAARYSHSESHRRRLRRRVFKLRQAGFIKQLTTPLNRPDEFILKQRGMDELTAKRKLPPRRVSIPRRVRQYRPHDTRLSDFTVTLALNLDAIPQASLVSQRAIYARASSSKVSSHNGWPITFAYDGQVSEHWLRPDRTLAAVFADRPAGRNARYFSIELDQGTESHNPSAAVIAATRFKLLAYEATFDQDLVAELLDIPYLYTLFLTTGPRRRDNMVALATEVVRSDRAAASMLFAVQPPAPTVSTYTDLQAWHWINGRGESVCLRL